VAVSASAPVPAEFRGRARRLIRKLDEADKAYRVAAARLLAVPCTSTRPKRVAQHYRRLGKQWQNELPAYGRLRSHATAHGAERLNLGNLRCRATTIAAEDWSEPGLAIELRSPLWQASPLRWRQGRRYRAQDRRGRPRHGDPCRAKIDVGYLTPKSASCKPTEVGS